MDLNITNGLLIEKLSWEPVASVSKNAQILRLCSPPDKNVDSQNADSHSKRLSVDNNNTDRGAKQPDISMATPCRISGKIFFPASFSSQQSGRSKQSDG